MSATPISVEWIDSGREPQCAPDPDYPDGKALDCTNAKRPACTVKLPYPARRCGLYVVRCNVCGMSVAATTAGRPDDPRSLTMPCKIAETKH